MSKIDELKADIEKLPSEEVAELSRWLSDREWEIWDKEIEADSQAGRLDFLVREARGEKAKGNLKRMPDAFRLAVNKARREKKAKGNLKEM